MRSCRLSRRSFSISSYEGALRFFSLSWSAWASGFTFASCFTGWNLLIDSFDTGLSSLAFIASYSASVSGLSPFSSSSSDLAWSNGYEFPLPLAECVSSSIESRDWAPIPRTLFYPRLSTVGLFSMSEIEAFDPLRSSLTVSAQLQACAAVYAVLKKMKSTTVFRDSLKQKRRNRFPHNCRMLTVSSLQQFVGSL